MAALPEDVAASSRAAAIVIVSDTALLDRFPTARDGKKAPAEGYCDSAADTEAILDARAALIGQQGRRRFAVKIAAVLDISLDGGVPCYRLIDDEQQVDATMVVGRIEIDLEDETSTVELFG
ncbi:MULTISPECIES: hypothetical protein [unclassified Sphingobium]|uniref:hypothetical protein n=1 Tax=unclassified Sphingobium TaxID=2611147 RepID=UPI00222494FE|nr:MULTISPECIES: hypothetical protein [unclassified Sphingobium]MCW2412001.1 hypothetical protein [Sphingobium sp. B8D3D]MCW2415701.1 hypothetical protein [Sphingobium sp. B8D3A]